MMAAVAPVIFRPNEPENVRRPKLNAMADRATNRGMMLYISSLPNADPTIPLLRLEVIGDWSIGAGVASAAVPAAATAVFNFKKDGAVIGQVTFALGATDGTVLFTDTALAAGSLFELYPPSPGDAALDRVSISVSLART